MRDTLQILWLRKVEMGEIVDEASFDNAVEEFTRPKKGVVTGLRRIVEEVI